MAKDETMKLIVPAVADTPDSGETCANCIYSHPINRGRPLLECRIDPPKISVFMAPPTVMGGQPQFIKFTGFPEMEQAEWCGKFEPVPVD